MYVVTVLFVVDPGHIAGFMSAVFRQAELSLGLEADCTCFDVCSDPGDPCRVYLYEKYTDEAAFQEHLDSPHFREFDAAVSPWVTEKQVGIWRQRRRPS